MSSSSSSARKKKRSGCLGPLVAILMLSICGVCIFAAWQLLTPQDLSDIKGRDNAFRNMPSRNLTEVLKRSHEKGHEVTIGEDEVNRWLRDTLRIRQRGFMGSCVEVKEIWIRLSPDCAEVIQEWEAFGRQLTVSMFIRFEVKGGAGEQARAFHLNQGAYANFLPRPRKGGRFGRLTVPEGFLLLVIPSFQRIADLYQREINIAFRDMLDIQIMEDQITMIPWPREKGGNGMRWISPDP